MKHISTALLLSTLAGLSLGVANTAHAQTTARFSTVEFKDTTLNDALEMIFQAANNPAHTIDPSASQVPIGAFTLQNIQWDAALRTLANQNNFKVSRGADGSYLVEPREPVLQNGEGGGGGMMDPRTFGSGSGGFGGSGGFRPGGPNATPFNPFGGGNPTARNGVNFEVVPSVTTQANAQTTPRFGAGGGTTGTAAAGGELQPPIYVHHIYVGGIAQLFTGSSVIETLPFVAPASAASNFGSNGNSNGGGFGGGQFGGGGGSFGGQSNGFGGQSSFGGGGFGGQSSFGGGFGGQSSFGGGNSFGGQSGGFGGFGF